ncbi:MAG: hypothetical protein QF792_08930 [Phycisphaerae bacterium]|jgi:V/A-type H+-transporting ATPase subunit E|nr:hypothetical protein [Phycisphaerae bacterium]
MAESIETFVAKLQSEGVEVGRQEADKLLANAHQEAEKIVADAKAQAEKILADARGEAGKTLMRGKTELELAARDALLRLREALSKSLEAVLQYRVRETLTDVDFLGKILHELILLYAKDEQTARGGFKVNVSSEVCQKLADWALQEIRQEKSDNIHMPIDLKGTLSGAGFEYTTSGATVEVTLGSVVEILSELVGPEIRHLLESAVTDAQEQE